MPQQNPFAAPVVDLVDSPRVALPGFAAGQLRLLGWLTLVSFIGSLALMPLSFTAGWLEHAALLRVADWLGFALVLLGIYLLLRFKALLVARCAARGLDWPVYLTVVTSLAAQLLSMTFAAELTSFGWPLALFIAGLLALGAATLWLGIVLLRVDNVYAGLRPLACLDIAGGSMLLSVLLAALAPLPLLAATFFMMRVFFQAAEQAA